MISVETFKTLFDVFIYLFTLAFLVFLLSNLIVGARIKKRRLIDQRKDEFYSKYGYSWDYVFVFEVYQEKELENLHSVQKEYSMKRVVDRCQLANLDTKCFYSCQRDEIYLKLRVEPFRLQQEADRVDYKLLLDEVILEQRAKRGKFRDRDPLDSDKAHEYLWGPIDISNDYNKSKFRPYQYIYAKYDQAPELQELYQQYETCEDNIKLPFRAIDRYYLFAM